MIGAPRKPWVSSEHPHRKTYKARVLDLDARRPALREALAAIQRRAA